MGHTVYGVDCLFVGICWLKGNVISGCQYLHFCKLSRAECLGNKVMFYLLTINCLSEIMFFMKYDTSMDMCHSHS